MATAKKTTSTKATTTKKTTTKNEPKPKLEVIETEPEQKFTVFERMAARFPFTQEEVDLGDGLKVTVLNRIGLGQMMALVKSIVDACVDEDRGEVHFELVDYVTKMAICAVYCNEVAPENNEIGYAAAFGAGRLYDAVKSRIDVDQLNEVWRAVSDHINAKQELFNAAAAKITIDMVQKLNELYEMMNDVTENFDGEEAVKAVRNLSVLTTGK